MSQQEDPSKEWTEFKQLNMKLRENIKLMSKQKDNLSSKHKSDRQKAKQEIDRLYNETCKIFTYLKALRHKSLRRREHSQHTLSNLCKTLDNESLDVKNFAYEQCDTLKQIAICDDYKSHSNEPKLVSTQEFYKHNPQPEIADIHDEKTKRLQFELQQRKQLQSNLREITGKVKTLSNDLSEKKKFLNNLKSKIGNVFNAILPLQKYMNLPSTMLYPNETEINLLPQQLFSIYQSFTTQIYCNNISEQQIKMTIINRNNIKNSKETSVSSSVSITAAATVAAASVLGKRKYKDIKKKDGGHKSHKVEMDTSNTNTNTNTNTGLEDGELSQEPPRKRARTSNKSSKDGKKDKRQNRDKSNKRRRHSGGREKDRSKSSGGSGSSDDRTSKKTKTQTQSSSSSSSSSSTRKETTINNQIAQIGGTMSVELNNLIDEMQLIVEFKTIGMELEFMYCNMYNLILVSVRNDGLNDNPNLYMELFGGHKMIALPDVLCELRYICDGSSVPYFSAFSWAQELGGNYIFNDMSEKGEKREIINLIGLEKVLKLRKENRISLGNQIKQLMDANGCKMYVKSIMDKVLDNKVMFMNKIVVFKTVNDKNVCKNKYSMYFKLVLERDTFVLEGVVEIKPGYPEKAPLFYINDIWNNKCKKRDGNYFVNECKNMEIKLNGGYKEYVNKENMHLLLSIMVYKLQVYFDVYVQSQMMEDNNNNNLICNQLSGSPLRIHRGRDRRQQY